jgi:hypothetical protein
MAKNANREGRELTPEEVKKREEIIDHLSQEDKNYCNSNTLTFTPEMYLHGNWLRQDLRKWTGSYVSHAPNEKEVMELIGLGIRAEHGGREFTPDENQKVNDLYNMLTDMEKKYIVSNFAQPWKKYKYRLPIINVNSNRNFSANTTYHLSGKELFDPNPTCPPVDKPVRGWSIKTVKTNVEKETKATPKSTVLVDPNPDRDARRNPKYVRIKNNIFKTDVFVSGEQASEGFLNNTVRNNTPTNTSAEKQKDNESLMATPTPEKLAGKGLKVFWWVLTVATTLFFSWCKKKS